MPSPASPDRPSRQDGGARPPKEEPEFVNERDLPTADEPRRDRRSKDEGPKKADAPKKADVAGVESAAGEEDPGAALDTLPTSSPTRRPE
jgi:hypothetical protein